MSFKPFIKRCSIYYFYFGLLLGIVLFVVSLFNKNLTFTAGTTKFYGVKAAILGIVSIPLIMIIVGFIHSFFLYPIFNFLGFIKK